MVKDISVIYSKNEIILILISLNVFSHPEKSIHNLSLPYLYGGIVIPGPGDVSLLPFAKLAINYL